MARSSRAGVALVLASLVALAGCAPASAPAPSAVPTPVAAVTTPTRAPATPKPSPTPTPIPFAAIKPNELGKIMVLEYHEIGDHEERWMRSRDGFRKDLAYLYDHGYRLTRFGDLLADRVTTPAGMTPVVLTFDDSNRSQFQFVAGPDGKLTVDPASGLGILEAFIAQHPDFGRAAVFCVLPGADAPNDLFGQPQYRRQKLQYLADHGYEICNHTLWHATLTDYGPAMDVQQIALGQKWIDDLVPGYTVTIFDPPHGAYPKDESLIVSGTYQGTTYHNLAALEVGAEPMTAPDDRATDFLHTARIQAIPSQLDLWSSYFEQHPGERYVSDGDPGRLVFPVSAASRYKPRAGATEVASPDPAYEVIRLP